MSLVHLAVVRIARHRFLQIPCKGFTSVCCAHASAARPPAPPATLTLATLFQGMALAPIPHHRAPLLLLPFSPALSAPPFWLIWLLCFLASLAPSRLVPVVLAMTALVCCRTVGSD